MIFKIIGLICAFFFFFLIGMYQSLKLKTRKDNLNTILLFLNRLSTAIRYRRSDILSLIVQCADDVLTPLKNADDFILCSEIIGKLPLHKEEKSLLNKLFTEIGQMDLEGELKCLKLYTGFFDELYEKSKKDIENKSKLYRMLGVFSGLAFVVMFI